MQSHTEHDRDIEGYLVNPEDWNESLAQELATKKVWNWTINTGRSWALCETTGNNTRPRLMCVM